VVLGVKMGYRKSKVTPMTKTPEPTYKKATRLSKKVTDFGKSDQMKGMISSASTKKLQNLSTNA
jgi:hypothetical protein